MGIAIGVIVVIVFFWAVGNGIPKTIAQILHLGQRTREEAPVYTAKAIHTSSKAVSVTATTSARALSCGVRHLKTQADHAKSNGKSRWATFKADLAEEKAKIDGDELREKRVAASKAS